MTIVGYIVGALGALLIFLNYSALVTNHRNKRQGVDRHQSFIPLLGGILGATGFYLATRSEWAPLIALLDPGCLVLLLFPFVMLKQKFGARE
jgi:hypothetical protein